MARSFGHHRATILAALANGGLLLAVTGLVAIDAVARLVHPRPVHGGIVAVVALGTAALNVAGAALVHERRSRPGVAADLNMSAATLHLVSDAAVSLAVAAAGLVIVLSHGTYWVDPAVSLVVCVAIAGQAVRLLHRSADVLLESTPKAIDPEAVLAAVRDVPTVVDVHDLHVWSLSSRPARDVGARRRVGASHSRAGPGDGRADQRPGCRRLRYRARDDRDGM